MNILTNIYFCIPQKKKKFWMTWGWVNNDRISIYNSAINISVWKSYTIMKNAYSAAGAFLFTNTYNGFWESV